ncbi:hypothetical protein H0H81_007897 [Sphagnurus paluster]|uniref:Uncharacterized protein n=1 Tax=Sphagnurus paluster TaxID=117069 RepID=A0A9P7GEB3_9AGAR|nr:hypothetical protein H0H81_007897 [Sphagnurus paluster]
MAFYAVLEDLELRDDFLEKKKLSTLSETSKKEIAAAFTTFISDQDLGPIVELSVELSWNSDFIGDTAALMAHVRKYYHSQNPSYYGRFLTIVQSSGMGKSRLLDQLSKEYFTILLNLREDGSKGYPPADVDLRNFLLNKVPSNAKDSERYLFYFMVALFETTHTVVQEKLEGAQGYTDTAAKFRLLLTQGQTIIRNFTGNL